MKRQLIHLSILASGIFLYSCTGSAPADSETTPTEDTAPSIPKEETEINDSTAFAILENNGITLTEVSSPKFPDAQLSLNTPIEGEALDAGEIGFEFNIESESYVLGSQTDDAETKGCANSGKGQHIHLILNNEPYSAHYESSFTKELDAGSYVALAFISRSYHESLKHDGAAVLTQFTVGGAEAEEFDMEAEHLFYSRPKGNYEGEAVDKVMLDFYLVNTIISSEGNYVEVIIDGNTTFNITKWVPYFMKGLEVGDHTIKITLMDKEGTPIEGPFNTEERTFTLTK